MLSISRFFALLVLTVLLALAPVTAWGEEKAGETDAEAEPMPKVEGFLLEHNIGEDGISPRADFVKAEEWYVADFAGRSTVRVEGNTVILEQGNDMTGIVWKGPLARMNYEISLEAKRVAGSDFFCGLTFPYGDNPCSLIVGGWGGTLVGLSSLDYQDAYNNETGRSMNFDMDRWYRIRLRTTPERIQAWIDDEELVNARTKGRVIDIRWEMERCLPLGVATWRTSGALRNVKFTVFEPEDHPLDP